MTRTLKLAPLAAGILLSCSTPATSAPTPPLCLDSICIEDEVGKLKDLNWKTVRPEQASKAQWDEAMAYWETIFPNQKESLIKVRQNLVQRRLDGDLIAFLEKHPATCRFEGFTGTVDKGDVVLYVRVSPDVDHQWRVTRITKGYRELPNSDHKSSYIDAIKTKYTQWPEDNLWGDAEAPVTWEKNPLSRSLDFKLSLKHLVSYGRSQDSAHHNWAHAFDHFAKHREMLAEKGIDSVGTWSSDTYDALYKNAEACTPKVTL